MAWAICISPHNETLLEKRAWVFGIFSDQALFYFNREGGLFKFIAIENLPLAFKRKGN